MIIAATGHRPDKLGGYGQDVANKLTWLVYSYFDRNKGKIDKVISGMALGFDLAIIIPAFHFQIPVVAAVPFDGQELRWPHSSQVRYREQLARCAERHVVSPGPYAAWKMHKRNEWMVDNSDAVMALWNGDEPGGTAACVRYAQSKQKPIDNLWDTWLTFKPVPFERTP